MFSIAGLVIEFVSRLKFVWSLDHNSFSLFNDILHSCSTPLTNHFNSWYDSHVCKIQTIMRQFAPLKCPYFLEVLFLALCGFGEHSQLQALLLHRELELPHSEAHHIYKESWCQRELSRWWNLALALRINLYHAAVDCLTSNFLQGIPFCPTFSLVCWRLM